MVLSLDFVSKYSQVKQDNFAAPTIYYGVTTFANAVGSTSEWAVLRESVVGGVTTYSWASGTGPNQNFAWDDRATLSY